MAKYLPALVGWIGMLGGCGAGEAFTEALTDGGELRFVLEGECAAETCGFHRLQVAGPLSEEACTGKRDDLISRKNDGGVRAIVVSEDFEPVVWSVLSDAMVPGPVPYGDWPVAAEIEAADLESGSCYAVFTDVTYEGGRAAESFYFTAP